MTEAERNILQYYQNRSLVFQALIEKELETLNARKAFLENVLETTRKMDEVFGQPKVDNAQKVLMDRIRSQVPGAEGLTDAELMQKLQTNPEFLNNVG